jgi:hypothetical protein
LNVRVEAQRTHRPQYIVAVNRLALLLDAFVTRLRRDEANKLGHALLDRLLGILADLGVRGQDRLHDSGDVRDGQIPILLAGLGRSTGTVIPVVVVHIIIIIVVVTINIIIISSSIGIRIHRPHRSHAAHHPETSHTAAHATEIGHPSQRIHIVHIIHLLSPSSSFPAKQELTK